MPHDDFDLARRLIAGEESAFDEFFADYFPRVYRFARMRLGGDDDAAEEVVQTTLIKALDKVHTYRGEAALFTWVCAVCRREIAAWFRRTGKTVDLSLADERTETRAVLDALTTMSGQDPQSDLDRRELSRLVQATLDHLPAAYGNALEWKYIDGLSVDEVAARLGLGYKAAESLLTRARQAFREGFSLAAPKRTAHLNPGPTET